MPRRRYTEQQFRTAVADPGISTLAELCRALGIVPRGANYEVLRRYARELDLDPDLDERFAARRPSPPRRRRRVSDEDLLAALRDPGIDGYPALCAYLGLRPHSSTNRRLRMRAAAHGVVIPTSWSNGRLRAEMGDHTAQELRTVIEQASSLNEAIVLLGATPDATAYARLFRSAEQHGLSLQELATRGSGRRRRPIEDYLVRGSRVPSAKLRVRLIREGLKTHRCELCERTHWRGQPIPLELDHIDGDRFNNELENLRLLCPNCHALTPTYRGRNIGRYRSST